jgi:hypothetical protein
VQLLSLVLSPETARGRVAIDKTEGVVKAESSCAVFLAPCRSQRVEDQNTGNLTLNHPSVKQIVSPTADTP